MQEQPRYHLIYRVVVIIGVVAALPLSVGFLLIQHAAKTRLTDATGTNFVWFAEHAASALDLAFVRELEFLSSVSRSLDIARQADTPRFLDEARERPLSGSRRPRYGWQYCGGLRGLRLRRRSGTRELWQSAFSCEKQNGARRVVRRLGRGREVLRSLSFDSRS